MESIEFLRGILKKDITKKILVVIFIGIVIYLMRGLLNLFLLTFLLAYLMYDLEKSIYNLVSKKIKVKENLITAILYIVIIAIAVLIIINYVPMIINQITKIYHEIHVFNKHTELGKFLKSIAPLTSKIDITSYTKNNMGHIMNVASLIGHGGLDVALAIILSAVFNLERKEISKFLKKIESSKIAGLYKYVKYFGEDFLNTFGKVIQAQILIAIVNSILSFLGLLALGFPDLLGLTFMIFMLSLIPVAGVIISLFPLCIIAFSIGGIVKVAYTLVLIAVIHIIESYILNPRFMSAKTRLPVFIVFVVLVVSKHFMGIWGLLIGLPLFVFFLDLLNINKHESKKAKKEAAAEITKE